MAVQLYLQMIIFYVFFAAADLQWFTLFKADHTLHLLAVFYYS